MQIPVSRAFVFNIFNLCGDEWGLMNVGLIHSCAATYAEYGRVAAALEARRESHHVFRLTIWFVHVLGSWSARYSGLPDGCSYRASLFSLVRSRVYTDRQNLTTTG